MNNKYLRVISAVLVIAGAISLGSCGQDSGSESSDNETEVTTLSPAEADQIQELVTDYFTKMYDCYNNQQYEEYLNYLRITDSAQREQMLNGLKSSLQENTVLAEIDTLAAKKMDDDLINVALVVLNTTTPKNAPENAIKIKEAIYFNMELVDDQLVLKNYISGGMQLVEDEE